ncbi:MAG: hypothetical protein WC083_06350 [Candidatus Methanomethylophilaceae archaeon]|jgi:hypothetical protein
MTQFMPVWEGFVIMIVTILIGVVMSFAGGTVLESMIDGYTVAGAYDVSPEWDTMGNINTICNLYFFLMYLIPVLGIAVFVTTILKRQKYDRYYPYQEEW